MKDKKLHTKIISGNQQAVVEFYNTTKNNLYRYVLANITNISDAEEVLQDAYISFFEALRDFHGDSSLKTYLYAITKRKICDYIRKKRVKSILFARFNQKMLEEIAGVFLDDHFDKKEIQIQIKKVLSCLPNDYAKIIKLKYIEGRAVLEIAQKLGLSFKATESMLYRARMAFIKNYAQYIR